MFKDYGFTEWNDVKGLLTAQTGKQVLSDTHRLIKDRKHLILTHRAASSDDESDTNTISDTEDLVQTSAGVISLESVKTMDNTSISVIYVDRDKLKFPLEVRSWEKGDVFHPFGMKGKKKLSKYFKDEKLSLVDKEALNLLVTDGKILWVVGKRADDRFKVTKKTKQILKIELNPQMS